MAKKPKQRKIAERKQKVGTLRFVRGSDHDLSRVNLGKPSPRSTPKPAPPGGHPTLQHRRQAELAAAHATRTIYGATARASLNGDLPAAATEPAPRAAPARAGGRFPSLAERVAREGVMAQYRGGRPGQLPDRDGGDDDGS